MSPAIVCLVALILSQSVSTYLIGTRDNEPEKVFPTLDDESDGGPDMTGLVDMLQNGFDINNLKSLIKNMKYISDIVHRVMLVSPVVADILNKVAMENPEAKILLKVSEGKYPDLKDMFDLATSPHRSITADVLEAADQNPNWSEISKLMRQPHPEVYSERIIELFVGKTLFSNQTKKIGNKYTVARTIDPNAIEMVKFFFPNGPHLRRMLKQFSKPPVDYVSILKEFSGLDYSHFPKTLNPEASAPSSGEAPPDPVISSFLHDVKVENPTILEDPDVTKAKAMAMEELSKLVQIFNGIMHLLKKYE